jgi:hypothetical protein
MAGNPCTHPDHLVKASFISSILFLIVSIFIFLFLSWVFGLILIIASVVCMVFSCKRAGCCDSAPQTGSKAVEVCTLVLTESSEVHSQHL